MSTQAVGGYSYGKEPPSATAPRNVGCQVGAVDRAFAGVPGSLDAGHAGFIAGVVGDQGVQGICCAADYVAVIPEAGVQPFIDEIEINITGPLPYIGDFSGYPKDCPQLDSRSPDTWPPGRWRPRSSCSGQNYAGRAGYCGPVRVEEKGMGGEWLSACERRNVRAIGMTYRDITSCGSCASKAPTLGNSAVWHILGKGVAPVEERLAKRTDFRVGRTVRYGCRPACCGTARVFTAANSELNGNYSE